MSWYIRQNNKPHGPITTESMVAHLQAGEISPEDLVWRDDDAEWKPAFKWPEFAGVSMPAFQEYKTTLDDEVVWVLLQDGKTTGPWSLKQIHQAAKEGRLKASDCIWKNGMTGWARIVSRPENFIGPASENLFRP